MAHNLCQKTPVTRWWLYSDSAVHCTYPYCNLPQHCTTLHCTYICTISASPRICHNIDRYTSTIHLPLYVFTRDFCIDCLIPLLPLLLPLTLTTIYRLAHLLYTPLFTQRLHLAMPINPTRPSPSLPPPNAAAALRQKPYHPICAAALRAVSSSLSSPALIENSIGPTTLYCIVLHCTVCKASSKVLNHYVGSRRVYVAHLC